LVAKQTTLKQPKSWRKVESANFFRFENHGDTIDGILTEICPKAPSDKMQFYKMKTFEGEEKKFHGSKQLDDVLSQFQVPCYLKITYVDDLETGGFQMKLFEVEEGEN
jgi:hypothetical protein